MDRGMECEYCGDHEHSIPLPPPNLFGKEIYLCRRCSLYHRLMEPDNYEHGHTWSISTAPRGLYFT